MSQCSILFIFATAAFITFQLKLSPFVRNLSVYCSALQTFPCNALMMHFYSDDCVSVAESEVLLRCTDWRIWNQASWVCQHYCCGHCCFVTKHSMTNSWTYKRTRQPLQANQLTDRHTLVYLNVLPTYCDWPAKTISLNAAC
jgi:hypothetical protein